MTNQMHGTALSALALSMCGMFPPPASAATEDHFGFRPAARVLEFWRSVGSTDSEIELALAPDVAIGVTDHAVASIFPPVAVADRETSPVEKLMGEIRRNALLEANWDGEGAAAPNQFSMLQAIMFSCMLSESSFLPESMIHSSGLAGLYWKDEHRYGDLEFLEDGQVAYYIVVGQDRHKGVVRFDGKTLPNVFQTLLDI